MRRDSADFNPQPPPALGHLDPLLQHRSRLGALALLAGADALTFARLKVLLEETDGNLGAQLRKLEDAGYVTAKKEFINRKPTTWYSLTPNGRKAMKIHLKAVEALLKSTD
ncbi:MAG TPA: transcriptional regulator [Tepidisphaeraceae bacterium]|jgi:DNA-binding MarR family transcriptional regulator